MNQQSSETRRCDSQSEVLNPNYEDLSLGWSDSLGRHKSLARVPEGPEYLNTTQNSLPLTRGDSIDNPDYQAAFLPQATPPSTNGLFLPAAENLEYLGVGAALHAAVR